MIACFMVSREVLLHCSWRSCCCSCCSVNFAPMRFLSHLRKGRHDWTCRATYVCYHVSANMFSFLCRRHEAPRCQIPRTSHPPTTRSSSWTASPLTTSPYLPRNHPGRLSLSVAEAGVAWTICYLGEEGAAVIIDGVQCGDRRAGVSSSVFKACNSVEMTKRVDVTCFDQLWNVAGWVKAWCSTVGVPRVSFEPSPQVH